jgi:tyramine---L-glutamate ligase
MACFSTVLVYEFFTAGGFPPGKLPGGLATEALGMLWALLADFRRWGTVRTITALDPRFEERVPGLNRNTLPANEVTSASPGNHPGIFDSLLKRCTFAMIIAPETGGVLADLTSKAESAGVPVLGSSSSAVITAGNKSSCDRLFRAAGLPTPTTLAVEFASAHQAAEQIGCPLIIKPVDGMGSEGVCRVDRLSEIAAILEMVRTVTSGDQILLQRLAAGTPVSVSLLKTGERCLPLSLNRQWIEGGSQFRYLGSEVPFHHHAGERAMELACSAVRLIPGLGGYVGVDLVLEEDSAQLIEINPRLTTSYIGLRQVCAVNLAQAITETCLKGILPGMISLAGRATIMKDDPVSWRIHSV